MIKPQLNCCCVVHWRTWLLTPIENSGGIIAGAWRGHPRAAPNGFLVNSFAGDDPLVCLDYVRAKLGLPEFSPERSRKPAAGSHGALAKPPEPPQDTRARAMFIWSESRDPSGTLVEVYLGLRRLGLPDRAANEAIRYHPDCPFERERFPAMICLVRGIVTNEPQGVHRTALMPDGSAVKRIQMEIGLDKMAAEAKADEVFLVLLKRVNAQGRNVSAAKGPTYAPAVFAAEPDNHDIKSRIFDAAMRRLLNASRIRIETSGPASRRRSALVLEDNS